jgi:hypothetical protein
MINVIYAEKTNEIGKDNHKVITTDFNALFVPRKGDLMNFKGLLVDLDDWQKEKLYRVHDVEVMLPNNILIYVYHE